MRRNNIKILTRDQIYYYNEKFEFIVDNEKVIVRNKNYNRSTIHDVNKSFFINSKIRKLTFTPEAMKIYLEIKDDLAKDESLVDVQQAVNKLFLLYQPITAEKVKYMLKKYNLSIKKI